MEEQAVGPDLVLSVAREDDAAVLGVRGELDAYSSPQLESQISEIINSGTRDVVLDLSNTRFLDSSGLRAILSAQQLLQEKEGKLRLRGTERSRQPPARDHRARRSLHRRSRGPMTVTTNADTVRLSVPATLENMRIVRLTVSGVASRFGYDVDEIENLRVAVDELASTIVDSAAGGELEITFTSNDGDFMIEGRTPIAPGVEVGIDELSAQILNAVCDKYEVRVDDRSARFFCARRLPTV